MMDSTSVFPEQLKEVIQEKGTFQNKSDSHEPGLLWKQIFSIIFVYFFVVWL